MVKNNSNCVKKRNLTQNKKEINKMLYENNWFKKLL